MILKELRIKGFRPFCEEQVLLIEPDVTVLTGANDVGKTAVLHLTRMLFQNEKSSEGDLNLDTTRRDTQSPEESDAYQIRAEFRSTGGDGYFDRRVPKDAAIVIEYSPNTPQLAVDTIVATNGENLTSRRPYAVNRMPRVIDLTPNEEIRSYISRTDVNSSEDHLLAQAFGPRYRENLIQSGKEFFPSHVRGGVENLNLRLRKVLPSSLRLGFAIEVDRSDDLSFVIGVVDDLTGDTPMRLRGSGAQRLLRLMTSLLDIKPSDEHVIILVDEPENSLHADAQHALRYFLETLGREPTMQVIYATHSASMINSTRPRCLRMISRGLSPNGNPAATIENEPCKGGRYQRIRTSLGMLPADSLLYATVTVIVEGETEELGLRQIVEKAMDTLPDDGSRLELEILYGQIHIVCAEGYSEIHKWVKLAKTQGSQPIVFMDGDHYSEVEGKLREKHSEVPIIHMDDGKDFEEIVSKRAYFAAVADSIGTCEGVSDEDLRRWYNEWLKEPSGHQIDMFGNRVKKWTEDVFGRSLSKPKVMQRAIEVAELDEIDLEKIGELTRAIRNLAQRL